MTTLAFAALTVLAASVAWIAWLRHQMDRRVADLRLSESYYRALLGSASDAVIVHSLEGDAVEFNQAARAAFGVRRGGSLPSLSEVIAPAFHDRLEAHTVILRARGTARCDLGVNTPDAEPRLFEFESRVMDVGGERRVLSLARDVGLRRSYEAELIAARRDAEEAVRLKSTFLASMSHEIRTPLTAVIGFAEILRDEVEGDQRYIAETIEKGGHRLLETLNSVLDLARLDSGSETLAPRPLCVVEQVRTSASLVQSLASAKGLALRVDADEAAIPAVMDAGALDRVVTNLVGNAIKFTRKGDVTVSVVADGPEVSVCVRDTGIGIEEAFLPDLFSEFRQESEGNNRRHEGSGLGLAITHRLVGLMGGRISVESRKGEGSRFTVILPRLAPGVEAERGAFAPEAVLSTSVPSASR